MKKVFTALMIVLTLGAFSFAAAMDSMDHGDSMDHSDMKSAKTFKKTVEVDGLKVEFQVMSLESMNMKDEHGATHHVMATFYNAGGEQIKNAVARVKVIDPKKGEQVVDMKDYSGILAANFKAHEMGKYGVICLFKVDGEKHVAKFWWKHM